MNKIGLFVSAVILLASTVDARAEDLHGRVEHGYADSGGVKIHYATQVEVGPPTFVLFVNNKKLFTKDYIRYLSNRFRQELPFGDIPVRIVLRDKDRESKEQTGSIS